MFIQKIMNLWLFADLHTFLCSTLNRINCNLFVYFSVPFIAFILAAFVAHIYADLPLLLLHTQNILQRRVFVIKLNAWQIISFR